MIWKFGKNINTDLITPGRFNQTTDPAELAKAAFIEYRPEFSKKVRPGDLIVAGQNFGCGSSRETAATSLKACGVKAILAESFARIFYRNCMNKGLMLIACDTSDIDETDDLDLDTDSGKLINWTKNWTRNVEIPSMMKKLADAGGIVQFIKDNGIEAIPRLAGVSR